MVSLWKALAKLGFLAAGVSIALVIIGVIAQEFIWFYGLFGLVCAIAIILLSFSSMVDAECCELEEQINLVRKHLGTIEQAFDKIKSDLQEATEAREVQQLTQLLISLRQAYKDSGGSAQLDLPSEQSTAL